MIRTIPLFLFILLLTGCGSLSSQPAQTVGLLVEDTIDDQGWNRKGYQGLLNIHSNLNVDVQLKEGVDNANETKLAVEELASDGATLIFGHGHSYADYFSNIHVDYPDVHFVSFNGEVSGENMTSVHFEGYAMGFFGGMVAASMSESNHVGVIAAFSWQPEVAGFIEGAEFIEGTQAHIRYVEDWSNVEKAKAFLNELQEVGADVFYPAGDGYHVQVVEEIKRQGHFAIGYVGDQSDLGESTVLTSTIQHVDELYELVASRYQRGELEAGNLYYDFQDGVISLGEFSSVVPDEVRTLVQDAISAYIETGELPNESK